MRRVLILRSPGRRFDDAKLRGGVSNEEAQAGLRNTMPPTSKTRRSYFARRPRDYRACLTVDQLRSVLFKCNFFDLLLSVLE